MGPTGTEGPFKIACEVALGLMRNQKDVLMSALRPFYFDPLLDWVPDGKHKKNDTGEVINEKAVETLKRFQDNSFSKFYQYFLNSSERFLHCRYFFTHSS